MVANAVAAGEVSEPTHVHMEHNPRGNEYRLDPTLTPAVGTEEATPPPGSTVHLNGPRVGRRLTPLAWQAQEETVGPYGNTAYEYRHPYR